MIDRRIIAASTILLGLFSAGVRAQSTDPLQFREAEARQWARRLFNPATGLASTDPWSPLERGSFQAFSERAEEYVRVFRSADRSVAAVVAYNRDPAVARGLAVVARLTLLNRAGSLLAAFDVLPHLEFHVANDGRTVVGHGETMVGAITCGILHNSLSIYAADGSLVRHVESREFSPAHSLVLLDTPRRIVLAVSGLVVAFDPASGRESWRRPLGHVNDTASLVLNPDGSLVAATVQTHLGDARVELIDGTGAERGSYRLSGRPAPGAQVLFGAGGYLAVRDIVDDETRLHLLDGRSLAHLRTISEF